MSKHSKEEAIVTGIVLGVGALVGYVASKIWDGASSSSGGEPPRQNPGLPQEHEVESDYDEEVEKSDSNPITGVEVGDLGRVQELWGQIKYRHLRKGPRQGRGYTERVRRFVERLGKVKGQEGVREGDEIGHIMGDLFGGPTDRTYNFFPQSPSFNMDYYHTFEKRIHDFLNKQNEQGNGDSAFVNFYVLFDYVDYHGHPNRPRRLRIKVEYSDEREEEFEFSNA